MARSDPLQALESAVAQTAVDWLLGWLSSQDVDIAGISQGVGVAPATISIVHYLELLNRVAVDQGNPQLGLKMAAEIEVKDFGLFGRLLLNCESLREAMRLNELYMPSISPAMQSSFSESAGHAIYVYQIPDLPPELCRHDVEFTLGAMVTVFRNAGGAAWHPESVEFQHQLVGEEEAYRTFFGAPVRLGQKRNALRFGSGILEQPIPGSDPVLARVIRSHIDTQMRDNPLTEDVSAQCRHYIANLLGTEFCTAEFVSRLLHLSERTLHRRLQSRDTTFRVLKQTVIEELARALLLNCDVRITQIAMKLGYSEAAAFNHAFRKRTGMSPTRYRESALRQR